MTIKDIARLSGCGVATVSRVLNNHPDVSEEKRRKVLEVVEEYGFQLNRNAKRLKQQGRTTIAILVEGTLNMLFADIVEQAQAILRAAGRDASVYYLDEDADPTAFAGQLCREQKPLGILFLGGGLNGEQKQLAQITVPCVLLTNTARELGFDNLSSLTTDDEAAAAQVMDYLADLGHRNIGVLGGNKAGSQISVRRLLGCEKALLRRGLPFEWARQWEACRYSMDDAYEAAGRLLDRAPDLTAIFAMSDVMAIGAIRALADRGKSVPGDISVVGFDGIGLASFCVPRLTTVKQDARRFARQGVDILLQNIENGPQPVHDIVPFQLVEGESAARLEPNRNQEKKGGAQP